MHLVPRPFPVPAGRLLTALAALALSLLAGAGCHVGSAEPGGVTPGGEPDASSTPAVDSGSTPEVDGGGGGTEEPPTECANFATEVLPGHHPAGYDYDVGAGGGCIGNCHKAGVAQGPEWTLAGAVYTDIGEAAQPVGGAHVWVTDAAGKSVHLITSDSGEFSTLEALEFPVQTFATGCPQRLAMSGPATANCNSAGACHSSTFRIRLPLQ